MIDKQGEKCYDYDKLIVRKSDGLLVCFKLFVFQIKLLFFV